MSNWAKYLPPVYKHLADEIESKSLGVIQDKVKKKKNLSKQVFQRDI